MNWQHLQAFVWLRLAVQPVAACRCLQCGADDDSDDWSLGHSDPVIHRLLHASWLYAIPKAVRPSAVCVDGLIVAFLFFWESDW